MTAEKAPKRRNSDRITLKSLLYNFWTPVIVAIIGIAPTYITKVVGPKPDVIYDNFIKNKRINSSLEDILKVYQADRVVVYEFHNGNHYYDGRSIQKVSCSYEVLANNINSEMMYQQNIPVTSMLEYLEYIINGCGYFCADVSKLPNSNTKLMFEARGIKSVYSVPLRDEYNRLLGYISLRYLNRATILSKKDLQDLSIYGKNVSISLRDEHGK